MSQTETDSKARKACVSARRFGIVDNNVWFAFALENKNNHRFKLLRYK